MLESMPNTARRSKSWILWPIIQRALTMFSRISPRSVLVCIGPSFQAYPISRTIFSGDMEYRCLRLCVSMSKISVPGIYVTPFRGKGVPRRGPLYLLTTCYYLPKIGLHWFGSFLDKRQNHALYTPYWPLPVLKTRSPWSQYLTSSPGGVDCWGWGGRPCDCAGA